MTKTQLLDTLQKKHGTSTFRYRDIEKVIRELTGYSTTKHGIGIWSYALYETTGHGGSKDPNSGYFCRPTAKDNRFLERVSRGKYMISYIPKPRGTMSKSKLIDALLKKYGHKMFTFSDLQHEINAIRGYSENTPLHFWSAALYGEESMNNGSYLRRPTVREGRYIKKVSRGKYRVVS